MVVPRETAKVTVGEDTGVHVGDSGGDSGGDSRERGVSMGEPGWKEGCLWEC